MSATKNVIVLGLTGKLEASYGVGASMSLSGPDSIQPAEFVTVPSEYTYDGARPAPLGTFGSYKRAQPNGGSTNFQIPVEIKGDGAGYATTADLIPNINALLRASGLSGSLSSATWSYSPEPVTDTPTSIAFDLYARGEKRPVSGGYCSFELGTDSAAPPIITFDVFGLPTLPSDVAVPAITYEAEAVIPPKAENIGFILNFGSSYSTAKVRSFNYSYNREISPRLDLNNTSGHGGFAIGRRTPEFTVQIEADSLSNFNPESIWSAGTNGSIILTLGTAAGNTWQLSLPQTQISALAYADDGPTALWDITFSTYVSAGDANDDLYLRFW